MTDGQDSGTQRNTEEKSRKGAILIALFLGAVAAGGVGFWTANRATVTEVPAVGEQKPAESPAVAPAQDAATAPEPAKVETTEQPAAEVAKVEPTPAVEAKPQEDAKPTEEAKVPEVAPAQQAAIAPKAVEPAPVESKPAEPAPVPAPAPAVEPPSFDTVRIEPAGDAVIAGRAAPGAEVHVMLDGVQIGSVVASEDGSFAYVSDKPLPAGTGTLTLEVVKDGKTLVSETSVAVAVKDQAKGEALVAVLKPGKAPEIVQAPTTSGTQAPAGTVALDSVDYDKDGNIVFSGRGAKRSTVRLYVDNALAGEVVVGEDGKWSYAGGNTVTAGQHMLRADALKADGSVASRVELPFLREEAAKLTAADEGSATADQQSAAVDAATPEVVSRMVIQPGNNLWKLSRKIYGKGMRYTVIWEANKDQIRNPDLIYPGQIFVMPKAE